MFLSRVFSPRRTHAHRRVHGTQNANGRYAFLYPTVCSKMSLRKTSAVVRSYNPSDADKFWADGGDGDGGKNNGGKTLLVDDGDDGQEGGFNLGMVLIGIVVIGSSVLLYLKRKTGSEETYDKCVSLT